MGGAFRFSLGWRGGSGMMMGTFFFSFPSSSKSEDRVISGDLFAPPLPAPALVTTSDPSTPRESHSSGSNDEVSTAALRCSAMRAKPPIAGTRLCIPEPARASEGTEDDIPPTGFDATRGGSLTSGFAIAGAEVDGGIEAATGRVGAPARVSGGPGCDCEGRERIAAFFTGVASTTSSSSSSSLLSAAGRREDGLGAFDPTSLRGADVCIRGSGAEGFAPPRVCAAFSFSSSALRTLYSRYMAYTCLSALTSSPVGFLPCAFANSVSQELIFTLQPSTFALIPRSPPSPPDRAPAAPDVDGTSATTPPLRSMPLLCAPTNDWVPLTLLQLVSCRSAPPRPDSNSFFGALGCLVCQCRQGRGFSARRGGLPGG